VETDDCEYSLAHLADTFASSIRTRVPERRYFDLATSSGVLLAEITWNVRESARLSYLSARSFLHILQRLASDSAVFFLFLLREQIARGNSRTRLPVSH